MLICIVPVSVFADDIQQGQRPRYTVLLLDASSVSNFRSAGQIIYTADSSVEQVKAASEEFLSTVSAVDGENYVALVIYRAQATVLSDFTNDFDALSEKIASIEPEDNMRDVSAALSLSSRLLANAPEDAVKNVILITTGITNNGNYSYNGAYDELTVASGCYRTDTGVKLYAYANEAISQAQSLKESGAFVYSIGLFQSMQSIPKTGKYIAEFFKMTAMDIATSEDHFYSVTDGESLRFAFSEIAGEIVNKLKRLSFTYQSGADHQVTCYYTNDYFANDSREYNASLATMSLSLAMSAFGSKKGDQIDYTQKSQNAVDLFKKIGIKNENITSNEWFYKKPTMDSIGVVAGNMPIRVNCGDYTLIAVAVRGGGYEQEWASNFTIGTTGQHQGFAEAKNEVLEFLKQYIADQNISGNVKLWLTGYSRAAATANLIAGAIADGYTLSDDITYSQGDVFAYCFETPAGALTSEVGDGGYENIFNILNSSDPVPYVAPSAMGFCRYGVDLYLPSPEADPETYGALKEKMLKIYYSLYSTSTYCVDDFQMKKLGISGWLPGGEPISYVQDDTENNFSQGLFLSNYITILSNEFIKNRTNYVESYQTEIREICSVFFGCTDAQAKIMIDSVTASAQSEWGSLAWSYVWNAGLNPWGDKMDAFAIVSEWLIKALDEAGVEDYDEALVDSAGKKLASLMLDLVVHHPNYFSTAVMNINSLGAAHFPELCFAWLVSMDSNYSSDAQGEMNDGDYRIVRINCPVDVAVYDEDGSLVASIINDKAESVEGSHYLYGIDDNGQKFVVLPDDDDYTVEITGRETDNVSYGVNEYDASKGAFVRNTNYFDVALSSGESMISSISASESKLTDSNDKNISCDSDLRDDDSASACYTVSVSTPDGEMGAVSGGGKQFYGAFSQVNAVSREGYSFDGWYSDGRLVSESEQYRFSVRSDVTLVARFSSVDEVDNPDTSDNTAVVIAVCVISALAVAINIKHRRKTIF